MRRIVTCIAVLSIVLSQRAVIGQDESASEHLKPMKWVIGEWVAESKVPPGHPDTAEEGATMISNVSWRWMLKHDFMVINQKRKVGDKTELGKEIIGWDAKSGQLVHWLFWEGGFSGKGEWTVDGDKLLLHWSMTGPGGKTLKGTSHLVKVDEDTFTWRGTDWVVDGEAVPDWPTVTYKRKKE